MKSKLYFYYRVWWMIFISLCRTVHRSLNLLEFESTIDQSLTYTTRHIHMYMRLIDINHRR